MRQSHHARNLLDKSLFFNDPEVDCVCVTSVVSNGRVFFIFLFFFYSLFSAYPACIGLQAGYTLESLSVSQRIYVRTCGQTIVHTVTSEHFVLVCSPFSYVFGPQ